MKQGNKGLSQCIVLFLCLIVLQIPVPMWRSLLLGLFGAVRVRVRAS